MEMFYPADSQRLPVETIQELNGQIFEGWDDGDMPFNDNDNEFETRSTISKEEFFEWEFNNG